MYIPEQWASMNYTGGYLTNGQAFKFALGKGYVSTEGYPHDVKFGNQEFLDAINWLQDVELEINVTYISYIRQYFGVIVEQLIGLNGSFEGRIGELKKKLKGTKQRSQGDYMELQNLISKKSRMEQLERELLSLETYKGYSIGM